jgi:hypothetical protein
MQKIYRFHGKTVRYYVLKIKFVGTSVETVTEPRMTEPRKTEPRKTERQKSEPRKTEYRKGPNIKRPNLEWDRTSKD